MSITCSDGFDTMGGKPYRRGNPRLEYSRVGLGRGVEEERAMAVLGVKVNANDGNNDGRPGERVVWKG